MNVRFRKHFLRHPEENGGAPAPAPEPAPAPSPAPTPAPTPAPSPAPAPAPEPAPAPPTPKWSETWREDLVGTLHENATAEEKAEFEKLQGRIKRFSSPSDMAKALREQDKLISSGQLKKPLAKNATPEQVKAWRAENGIPESPDKYDTDPGDGIVFGEEDASVITTITEEMHKGNADNASVKGALKAFARAKAESAARIEAANVEAKKVAEDSLRKEWGAEYRTNIDSSWAMVQHAGTPVAEALLGARDASGVALLHNPEIAKFLAGQARQLGFVPGSVVSAGGDLGEGMEAEIAKIETAMFDENGRKSDAYLKDEKMQARYTQLLEARERRSKTA